MYGTIGVNTKKGQRMSKRYEWQEEGGEAQRKALWLTALLQVPLLLVLFLVAFVTPLPLPGEEGVAVSFGDEQGEALHVSGGQRMPAPERVVAPVEEESSLTQDYEEAPALPSKLQPKKKQAERKPEAPTQAAPEPQPQVNPNALFPGSGSGTTTEVPKGKPEGSGNAPEGGTGSGVQGTGSGVRGGGGSGVSFSLGGRNALSLPSPVYQTQKSGRVVVKVWVDHEGRVVQAEPGARGSTSFDAQLMDAAKQAALKARFDVSRDAPARQVGTITYVFRLTQRD